MPAYVSGLIYLMALGTVVLDAAIVACVVALMFPSGRRVIVPVIRSGAFLVVVLLSIACVAGTLIMQYAGALAPCVLCWWQRVFLYPVALIALVAFFKNERFAKIADYVLALSCIGALIALYQHLLQVLPQGALIPCDATGDCAVRSVFEFNFVTIPWMAFTAFVALGIVAWIARREEAVL
ncbi:MAG TPA: disulfide bond formation protein B [Candidatus Paceibacterota bacterium]|nr:disulfide bond formation protein B [Candidatus Paceibacterota bacterium]